MIIYCPFSVIHHIVVRSDPDVLHDHDNLIVGYPICVQLKNLNN